MPDQNPAELFDLVTEIGTIEQLGRAILEARLPDGLIAPHFSVLDHLIRVSDGCTPVDLARAFQVPKTTMTHTLKGLVAQSLVVERPNPSDGRSKCIWLTDAGRALRDGTIVVLGQYFQHIIAQFGFERATGMISDLRALREFLDGNRALMGTDRLRAR